MKVRSNWTDYGFGGDTGRPKPKRPALKRAKDAASRPKPAPRSPRRAPATTKPVVQRSSSAPRRVALPEPQFERLRDQAGWPDYERAWVTIDGQRWWPYLVMEHSMLLLRGGQDLASAKEVTEFVRKGGPFDA